MSAVLRLVSHPTSVEVVVGYYFRFLALGIGARHGMAGVHRNAIIWDEARLLVDQRRRKSSIRSSGPMLSLWSVVPGYPLLSLSGSSNLK